MKKGRKEKNFIQKPVYPGGPAAIRAFIRANLVYPTQALKSSIEGTVSLRYTIDHKGHVIDTHVISSLGSGCDEEAIRLVRLLKFEVPKTHGLKVQFHKDIHVHFRLPKRSKAEEGAQTQFVYTTSDATPDGPGYHYTVTISPGNPDNTEKD